MARAAGWKISWLTNVMTATMSRQHGARLTAGRAAAAFALLVAGASANCVYTIANTSRSASGCNAPGTVAELAKCCADRSQLNKSRANLAGALPPTFQLAKSYTDLSLNPNLCGVISCWPEYLRKSVSSPLNLTGTPRVALDVSALAGQDQAFVPKLAMWLGSGHLSSDNLRGLPPVTQAWMTCKLLTQGKLVLQTTNYCRYGGGCNCTAKAQTSSKFGNKEGWDACHTTLAALEFPNASVRSQALGRYNSFLKSGYEPRGLVDGWAGGLVNDQGLGLGCGKEGQDYRESVVLVLLVLLLAILVPIQVCVACGYVCCCSDKIDARDQPPSAPWIRYAKLLAYLGGSIFDIATDWLFMWGVAETGNVRALLILGWLLAGPSVIMVLFCGGPLLLAAETLNPVSAVKFLDEDDSDDGERERWHGDRYCFAPIMLFLILGYCVCAYTLMVLATMNLHWVSMGTPVVSIPDCKFLAALFVGFSALGQVFLLIMGAANMWEVMSNPYLTDEQYSTRKNVAYSYLVLFEDVPQFIAQAVLFAQGEALLPARAYLLSAVPSLVMLHYRFMTQVDEKCGAAYVRRRLQRGCFADIAVGVAVAAAFDE